MVDLDSNKLTPARVDAELPALPEPEGTILKNHLKQVGPPVVTPQLHSWMKSHFLNGTILKMTNEQGKVLFDLYHDWLERLDFKINNFIISIRLSMCYCSSSGYRNWIGNICWSCYHCCSQWKLSTHNKPNLILIPFSLFYHPSFRHPLFTHKFYEKIFSVCKNVFLLVWQFVCHCKAMTLMDSAGAGVNI